MINEMYTIEEAFEKKLLISGDNVEWLGFCFLKKRLKRPTRDNPVALVGITDLIDSESNIWVGFVYKENSNYILKAKFMLNREIDEEKKLLIKQLLSDERRDIYCNSIEFSHNTKNKYGYDYKVYECTLFFPKDVIVEFEGEEERALLYLPKRESYVIPN